MKQELALFFKKLEINLVEAWDDEGNAIIHYHGRSFQSPNKGST
jgi:hypothetical protein